ncbi:MAG: hypothetical protein R2727_11560 [Bacteroidales bacterium]
MRPLSWDRGRTGTSGTQAGSRDIAILDYLLWRTFRDWSDDKFTHYRTAGNMSVPVIISTRGHRLEGIWHSGSPIGMLINAVRGMYVCVPRDMTRAAGFL